MKKPETKTLKPSTHKTLTRQTLTIRIFEKKKHTKLKQPTLHPQKHSNPHPKSTNTQSFPHKKNIYEVFFWVITPYFPFLPYILGLHSCQYRKYDFEITPSRFLRFDFRTNIGLLSVATSLPIKNLRVP